MALPSQKDRSGQSGRVYTSTKDNRFLARVGIAVGVALVIAGSLWGIGQLISNRGNASPIDQAQATLAGADPRKDPKTPTSGVRTLTGDMNKQPLPTSVKPVPPSQLPATGPNAGATPNAPKPDASKPGPTVTQPGSTNPNPATNPGATPAPGTTPNPSTTPNPATPPATNPALGPTPVSTEPPKSKARGYIESGERALTANKLVEARALLSKAYQAPDATDAERASIRTKLATVNQDLLFSSKITPGDPLVIAYTVQSGDALSKIARRQQLATDWRLIERINKVASNKLNVGQKLKLIPGPFHAIVTKKDFRLDLFAGSPEDPANWIYIRSFPVGLGTNDGTPVGTFVVRKDSKLVNPAWTNPKTGEHFNADDPKNPIGERWLGLEGLGSASAYTSYGIHGTIEPDSIGKQMSMGCIRLGNEDVELVYELLAEQVSVVKIQP